MIVVGVSRHGRLRDLFTGSTGVRIAAPRRRRSTCTWSPTSRRRAAAAGARRPCVAAEPGAAGRRLGGRRSSLPLAADRGCCSWSTTGTTCRSDLMLFLALTVLVALVGGLLPALVAAVGGFLLLNWFFTPPVGRFTIAEPENLVALVVFVPWRVGVASVVDRASRRAAEAAARPGRGGDAGVALAGRC